MGVVKGTEFVCEVSAPVYKLKVSGGRIAAKIGDIWHIIPNPPLLKPT